MIEPVKTKPNPNIIPGLGEIVANKRFVLGLSQRQVATALGLTQGAIAHLEAERRSLPFPTLLGLAAVLRCSVDELVPKKYLEKIRKNMTRCIDIGNDMV